MTHRMFPQKRKFVWAWLKDQWKTVGLFSSCFVIIAGAMVWEQHQEKIGLDGCHTSRTTQPHLGVLLDATDRLKPVAAKVVETKITQMRNALPTYSRLSVFGLVPAEQGIVVKEFSQCTPKPAAQANVFIENQPLLQKQNDSFDAGYQAAVQRVLDQPNQPESDIIAALYAVTAYGITDLIIIASDMLQHTSEDSMLRGDFTIADNSLYVVELTRRLQGAKILVIQLQTRRWAAHQKGARAFWEKLFTKAGAKVMWVDLPNAFQ